MPARPQRGGTTWIGARPTPAATGLLVAVVASFLVLIFLQDAAAAWVRQWLGLVPGYALGKRPWQLATSAFVAPGFGAFLGDALGVWFFATAVEMRVGRGRMLTLFAVAQILGAAATAGVALLYPGGAMTLGLGGCGTAVVAMLVAFGLMWRNVPLRLFGVAEMRGGTLALIFVGIGLLLAILNRNWPVLAGEIVGAGVGWALTGNDLLGRVTVAWKKWRLLRLRRKYKVISGGRDTRRYMN
jgi:membrane associated rhomboid family serine protease